ncbi:serologically defined colon cancer antigen 8 homolog isoform X3 [Amyelois transitella]|uniref:serologically defined colon cancer antigen 8 homolog isoform X3 n=1 Tax=Amyelois transitella TaxID=680683 RepID=UPI00298F4E37|nr:serologically defined colon cancer antigen 8 homolog isoform X3 [Amyelois transitella]
MYPYFWYYRRPTKMSEYGLKRVPDYTELAYKEAVSKLRYFLSGNYAPSVRSYGGSPSLKNLDESDDLDKKYASYNTLTEYKPRPRLTAKYATLYADSLNNYTPQHVSSTPNVTMTPVDPTSAPNPDVINFIQKQEEYIEQLERESQYCRDELNNLLGKVKEVISENENLHEAQKNKLISRMFHSYNGGSETDELDDLGDSTGLDSDNKTTPKSRRCMKGRSSSVRLEGPNIVFESRIAELEAQLTQAKIDLKKVQEENNENKRKLASGLVDTTCLDGFKRQIDNLQRDKSSLEAQIEKLKLSLDQKEGDFDGRYKRSDAVEQQLREERNNLEIEIRRLKDDLSKERSKVRELASEGSRRAIQERSAAEQRYNAHFDELQHDLAAQYDNVSKLQLDLERQRREENDLKRELSMKNSAIEELKMELKNKTSSLQADLAQAHAEKASLEEELASARLAIERHQRQAKHEANRLNSEIQSLRQRLDRADADVVHSRRENLRLSEQISTLEKELNMKNLTPVTPEKNKKELSTMMESMENKHAKKVAGLESMIQSQNSLMEKLTGECRLLTDKLDDANRRHKEELATLQRQVESIGRSLQPVPASPSTYQAPPTRTPSADRTVPHPPSNAGPDHPRAESTRVPQDGDSVTNIRPDSVDINDHRTPRTAKQDSRSSLLDKNVINDGTAAVVNNIEENVKDDYEHQKDMDVEQMQQQDFQPEMYNEGNFNYEQNYEQNPEQSYGQAPEQTYEEHQGAEYQNGGYVQNYEQQPYTGQYENYEQYPEQQYVDPNAQYEGQYENYATDGNYEQNYDNTQYNQEYANNDATIDNQNPKYDENIAPTQEIQEKQATQEIKTNDAPKELSSQS